MAKISWGLPDGIPEGSDFTLTAYLSVRGQTDSTRVTSSGTFTLTISDTALNGGTALLTDEASDSVTTATGKIVWNITDTQSNGWEAGLYKGDIKCVDSGLLVTYWEVECKIRGVKD